jgi:uncharacterized membrane protein
MSNSNQAQTAIYNIVAFILQGKDSAKQVEKNVMAGQKAAGYRVLVHAVVSVDEKGKVHISEPGRGGLGATAGVVAGGLLGLIGGPAGLLAWAVAGGTIGGVAGHYAGRVIKTEDLKNLGARMQPNTSAILALVEDEASEELINRMEGVGAHIVTLTIGNETSGELAQVFAAEIGVGDAAAATE